MSRAFGYGLVLLAATNSVVRSGLAMPGGPGLLQNETYQAGPLFLSGAGSGAASVHGTQGYLGVNLRDVSDDQLAALKLKVARGAEIILVDHDAPAGKAGLREHDVVLQMNGQVIQGGDQISRMLHECAPGKTIVLLISRDGQQMTVTTQMGNKEEVERRAWEQHLTVPEPQTYQSESDNSTTPSSSAPAPPMRGGNSFIGSILMNPSYTGAMLEQMSTQLAQFFGVASGTGLLVRSVADNSPAAQAGMHAGDVVVRANDQKVASTGDWSKALKNSHGRPLTVIVLRDKKEQTLTLTPDAKKRSSLEEIFAEPERTVVSLLSFSWVPHL